MDLMYNSQFILNMIESEPTFFVSLCVQFETKNKEIIVNQHHPPATTRSIFNLTSANPRDQTDREHREHRDPHHHELIL
jgi:hypothetical protein